LSYIPISLQTSFYGALPTELLSLRTGGTRTHDPRRVMLFKCCLLSIATLTYYHSKSSLNGYFNCILYKYGIKYGIK